MSGPPADSRHAEYLARRAAVLHAVGGGPAGGGLGDGLAGDGLAGGGLAGGDGPLMVLLPGFGGLDEFEFLAPMLARRHRVLALELADAPFDEVVAHVHAALPVEPLTLVGFSFGALVALAVAEEVPSLDALVLGSGRLEPDDAFTRFARLWLRLRETDPDALPELERFALLGPASRDDARIRKTAGAQLRAALEVDLSAHQVAAPTLVLAGEHDALVAREHSERLFGSFDDARLETLDAGHALLAERPAEVLALIERFLTDTAHPLVRVAG
ncbi:alpha/beta fold hydrolase [Microbacteriaceae bacterium VKM Ac-2855]|nr:alpha/beta fold hydrolase [Microbacteriaceae bacterium VKM Ac-2855]